MSSRLVVAKKPPLFPPLRVVVVVVVVVATRRVKVVVINTNEMILDRIEWKTEEDGQKSRTPSTRDESLVWRGLFLDRRFLLLLLLLFFLSALLSSNSSSKSSSSSSDAFNRHRYAHSGMMMFWDHIARLCQKLFFFGGKHTHTRTQRVSSLPFRRRPVLSRRRLSSSASKVDDKKHRGQKHSSLFFVSFI